MDPKPITPGWYWSSGFFCGGYTLAAFKYAAANDWINAAFAGSLACACVFWVWLEQKYPRGLTSRPGP